MELEIKTQQNVMAANISQDLQNKLKINSSSEQQEIKARINANQHIFRNVIGQVDHSIDWLGQLSHLSKIPYHQMLNWSEQLLDYINGKRALMEQPLNSLTLCSFTREKQTYLCFCQSFHSHYTLFKIRAIHGNLAMFKIVQNQRKIETIAGILNKIGQKGILIMLDEQGNQQIINKLTDVINVVNLIYIYPGTPQKPHKKPTDFLTKSYTNHTATFHPKTSKKLTHPLQQFIKAIILYQQQDYNKLLKCFGENHSQICYDRSLLIAYLLKYELDAERDNVMFLRGMLNSGIGCLKEGLKGKDRNKGKHFPRRSQGNMKHYCGQCGRRCDIYCQGCENGNGKLMYLCAGKCFWSYHKLQISLIQNGTKTELSKNILFFDDKCQIIKQKVNEFQQLQNKLEEYQNANAIQEQINDFVSKDQQMVNQKSGLVREYYDYLNYKMIKYFNLIAQRRLYERKDDAQSVN